MRAVTKVVALGGLVCVLTATHISSAQSHETRNVAMQGSLLDPSGFGPLCNYVRNDAVSVGSSYWHAGCAVSPVDFVYANYNQYTVFRISRPVADTLTRVSGRGDWRQVSALEPISLERRRSWGHRATVTTPGSRVTIRARVERPGSASCVGPLKHPSSPVPPRWRHSETGRAR